MCEISKLSLCNSNFEQTRTRNRRLHADHLMKAAADLPSASPLNEGPRRHANIPQPFVSKSAVGSLALLRFGMQHLACMQLEEKLKEFQKENGLLGRLLQDAQAERRSLEGRLSEVTSQCEQSDSERQGLRAQVSSLEQLLRDREEELSSLK